MISIYNYKLIHARVIFCLYMCFFNVFMLIDYPQTKHRTYKPLNI